MTRCLLNMGQFSKFIEQQEIIQDFSSTVNTNRSNLSIVKYFAREKQRQEQNAEEASPDDDKCNKLSFELYEKAMQILKQLQIQQSQMARGSLSSGSEVQLKAVKAARVGRADRRGKVKQENTEICKTEGIQLVRSWNECDEAFKASYNKIINDPVIQK